MSESSAESTHATTNDVVIPQIPIEIVCEEEMAFIDAALAAATRCSLSSSAVSAICSPSRSPLLSSQFQRNPVVSVKTIGALPKRGLSGLSSENEIEDMGDLGVTQKKTKVFESLLERFRKKRALSVTDITGAVWTFFFHLCSFFWGTFWIVLGWFLVLFFVVGFVVVLLILKIEITSCFHGVGFLSHSQKC